MTDRRIVKTQQQITSAFLSLISTEPISKISVSKIARMCDINRGTFYLHYNDVFDLYDQISKQFIDELEKTFDAHYPQSGQTNFLTLAEHIISYLNDNQQQFKALLQADNSANFTEQIRQMFIDKVIEKEHIAAENEDDIIDVIYNVNGATGVILAWMQEKLTGSQATITKRLAYIFTLL